MSPLRHPVIRRVLVSDLVSRLGSRMSFLALPWFVLVTTGSAARMGLVFGAEILPVAVLGIPSARVIARLGVRRTVVGGDAAQAILVGLVPALWELRLLSFWVIVVLVLATGTVAAPYFAAQRLLLPEAVGDDEQALTGGMAVVEASTWGSQLLGPAIAGVLIVAIGALNVLWIDAASFVVSAVVLYGLPKPVTDLSGAAGSGGALAGARYAIKDPILLRLVLAATGYGIFIPFILMCLPVLADTSFGHSPRVAGALLAAWGGGAFLGTFAVMPAVQRIPPLRLGALGGIAMAIPLWFMWISQPSYTLGILMAVSGLFVPMLNAPGLAILTSRPPAGLRTQVMTFFVTAATLAGPVAFIGAGFLLTHLGVRPVLIAIAIGTSVCALILATLLRTPATPTGPAQVLPEQIQAEPEVVAHQDDTYPARAEADAQEAE
jgi:MFS family permease